MKTFLDHLAENQKTYEFKIKIANIDPNENMDRLESVLGAYGLESISKPKRLPITASNIDFPGVINCQVYLMEAVFKYPCNDVQLRAMISERAGIPQANIVVVPKNHPEELWRDNEGELREYVQGEDVLTKPLPDATADQKAAGKFYSEAGTILKELNKPVKVEIAGNDTTIGGAKDSAYGKTTNDIAQGQVSPVGSKQNKIPSTNKGRA